MKWGRKDESGVDPLSANGGYVPGDEVMALKKLAFAEVDEDIEVVGVNACGGCPGKSR